MEDFVELIGPDGLYGIQLDTVNSLILSLLPSMDFEFQCFKELGLIDVVEDIRVYMLRLLIQCLRRCCGLYIPYVRTVCSNNFFVVFVISCLCSCMCAVS